MATSEAQKRASKKYIQNNYDTLYTRVPIGQKEVIKNHAATEGESVNEFVLRAINETMQRDQKKKK